MLFNGEPSSSVGGAGRFSDPWSSTMARPEGVWRRGGSGFGGLVDGSLLLRLLFGSLFMPFGLDLWRYTVGIVVVVGGGVCGLDGGVC